MPRSAEQCLAVGREYYIKKYYQKRWENDSFKRRIVAQYKKHTENYKACTRNRFLGGKNKKMTTW